MDRLFRNWLFVLLSFIGLNCFAQAWMPGYEFRRKIIFDKTKVEGEVTASTPKVDLDAVNFPVLLEMQDDAYKYALSNPCAGYVADIDGRNISFATVAAPTVKLSFQIEHYDPVQGKYRCWVKIPSLSASKTATPATEIFFYYGGTALHSNYSAAGLATWNSEYTGVWHMNAGLPIENVTTAFVSQRLIGYGLAPAEDNSGKIGAAVELDGQSQYLRTTGNANNAFTISAWVKWNGGATPQVIAANDSINPGKKGWQLRVKADGKIELTTYMSASLSYVHNAALALVPNQWTHIACYYSISSGSSSVGFLQNGVAAGGAGGGIRLAPAEGYISIGRSKDGSQYFNGSIDELRIFNTAKPTYWLRNEYRNQQDPASFYTVAQEEFSSSWATFTGASSANWGTATNWVNSIRPVAGSKVRISAGKATKITGSDIAFGQLVLEAGSALSSAVNLQLNCNVKLAAGAVLNMDAGRKLVLGGEGLKISGSGSVNTGALEVMTTAPSAEVSLESDVRVSNYLKLSKGLLRANGKLTLLSSSSSHTASLLPITDLSACSLIGEVIVQATIDGSFPEPSTGRGWRLLCSPVTNNGFSAYGLNTFKECMFVTGSGGAVNGFDDSPKNSATIYTHDQSISGTLSQKYVPVTNMQVKVPIGKGMYVYSRGSRFAPNAFRDQVVVQPFSNPAPYLLSYKGNLFIGDLTIPVFNKNSGTEGDGFNLLGNPYAAPVKWGALEKVNLGPFVWLFDPKNATYVVSDDPETIIPVGAGFFVKVKNGFTAGSVSFSENAKIDVSQ